jgi:hypothetical protein
VEDDVAAARQAALTSHGTRFFLYRFGCDPVQLDRLREESGGGPALEMQERRCAEVSPE